MPWVLTRLDRIFARIDSEHSEFAVTSGTQPQPRYLADNGDAASAGDLCYGTRNISSSAGSWCSRWCSARTGALVATAPIFGTMALPRQVRALLAVAISLLVTPVFLNTSLPPIAKPGRIWPADRQRSARRPVARAGNQYPVFRRPGGRADRQPAERNVARRRLQPRVSDEDVSSSPRCFTS